VLVVGFQGLIVPSSYQPTLKHPFNIGDSTTSYYQKFLANFDKNQSKQKAIQGASTALWI